MNIRKKSMSVWLVGGALAVGGLAVGNSASAACSLGAQTPFKNGSGLIAGTGTRGTTCSGTATVTVTVRRQRSLQPDDVIANNAAVIGNGSVTATSNKTSGTVRTRTNSSTGAQSESAWVGL